MWAKAAQKIHISDFIFMKYSVSALPGAPVSAEAGCPGNFSQYRSLGPDLCALISFSGGVALSMCLCLLFLSLSICILRGALCLSQCLSSPHLHVCLSLCHCFLCPQGEDIPLWNMRLCSFLLLCPPECHMLQKGESFGLWR